MIDTKEEFLYTPIILGKTEESEEDEISNVLKDSPPPASLKKKLNDDSPVSPSKMRT